MNWVLLVLLFAVEEGGRGEVSFELLPLTRAECINARDEGLELARAENIKALITCERADDLPRAREASPSNDSPAPQMNTDKENGAWSAQAVDLKVQQ